MNALLSVILVAITISPVLADTTVPAKSVATAQEAVEAFRQQYAASPNRLGLNVQYGPCINDPKQLRATKVPPEMFARKRKEAESRSEGSWTIYGFLQPFTDDTEVWRIKNTDPWHRFGAFLDARSGRVFYITAYPT